MVAAEQDRRKMRPKDVGRRSGVRFLHIRTRLPNTGRLTKNRQFDICSFVNDALLSRSCYFT